jgi:hypothetical protein
VSTRTTLFSGIYPRSIKYAYRDVLIGVFSNTPGDPSGNTPRVYQFKESIDGINWIDIKINNSDTISSTKDPLIEGDKYGNFIVAVYDNNKYNLYRYNSISSNFETLFDNTFDITDVFSINFVSNEWQIALEIGSVEHLIKSYDLTKWFKTGNNVEGGSKVRKISYKHERVNPVIYGTTNNDNPVRTSDVIAYNILYNPDDGAGVRAVKAEGLATYQGSTGGSPRYHDVNGTLLDPQPLNKEPNDIIHVNGKIFIASNKKSTTATPLNNFGFPLVESNGTTSTAYQESETIYGSVVAGLPVKIPVSDFADNLRRLYSSPRDPEIIFTVGDFTDSTNEKYGVILYRSRETSETYELATDDGYYWRVLMGPPESNFNASVYARHTWMQTFFEDITDVAMSKTSTQMVVVGKAKTNSPNFVANYNLVIFPNAFRNDFRKYTAQKLDFEIIYTVCNLGDLWVVGGKPSQSNEWNNKESGAVFNNKCVAYTFDLENWKYIDFTDGAANVSDVTMPGSPFFNISSQGTQTIVTNFTNFEANDIKPLELYGQTGILLQISFNIIDTNADTFDQPTSGNVAEKIYFMYVTGENLTIKQNNTYPEPTISFSQNRKQLVPSFTTIVNNVERRFVATDYPSQFNLFYVVYKNNEFELASYSDNNLINDISESGTKPDQRFRKMIYINENSIIKRSNGHCYKIAKVKNENFVTGVNSARYVAVGKGNFSNILWSDDLLLWNDTDTTGIFDIAFDVTHKHGMWVAIGTGNHQVAISKDGKKWTGIYPKYNDNSPEIITEGGVSFNSLEYPAEELFFVGVQATADFYNMDAGVVTLPDGFTVTGLTVTNGGSGYTFPPVVTLTEAGGRTASGTTLISNGSVTFAYFPPGPHEWMNPDGTVSNDPPAGGAPSVTIDPPTHRDNIADLLPYVPNLKGIFLRNLSILRLFSRIEYHVGSQIWQTLTFDDIKAMLDTEFGSGEYAKLLKNCSIINKNGSTKLTTWIPGFTKTLNSKLETFVNISENGSFPSGLLKDQKLSIKVYYNNLENVFGVDDEGFAHLTSSNMNNAVFDNFMNNTLIPCDRNPNYFIDSFLADNYGFNFGTDYQNVNGYFKLKFSTEIQRLRLYCKQFEMDDTEINEFNKGVKQVPKITQSLYFDADNVGNLLLDLDNFNLYASHIIVSGWLTSDICITDMNLELNGYSYNKTVEPSVIDFATKLCLGLNYNRYTFNGVDKEDGIGSLVIPLASTAYSGSSVPLDRYSSIRLRINFNAIAGPRSYINVTCVGTTTVSYNNSTANIDLY